MKLKSVLFFVLAVIIAISSFVACNSNVDEKENGVDVSFAPAVSKALNQDSTNTNISLSVDDYYWEVCFTDIGTTDNAEDNHTTSELNGVYKPFVDASGKTVVKGLGNIKDLKKGSFYLFGLKGYDSYKKGELIWEGYTHVANDHTKALKAYKLTTKKTMVSVTVVEKGNGFLYFNISAPVVSTWNFSYYGQPTRKDVFKYSYCTLNGSIKQTTPTTLNYNTTSYDQENYAFFYSTPVGTPEMSLPAGDYLFTVWQQTWNSEANNGYGAYEDVIGRKQVLIVSIEHGINTVIAGSLDSTAGLIKFDYEANGYTNYNQKHIKVMFTDANPSRVKEFSAAVYNENGDLQKQASTGIHNALGYDGENLLIKWQNSADTNTTLYVNGDQIKEDSDGKVVTGSNGFLKRIDEIDTYIKTSSTNSIICKVSKDKVYMVTIVYSSGTDINESVSFTVSYTPKPASVYSTSSFSLMTVNQKKNWDGTIEYDDGINGWRTWDGKRIYAGYANGKYVLKLRGYGNTVLTGKDDEQYGWQYSGYSNLDLSDISLATILDYTKDISDISLGEYAFAYLFKGWGYLTGAPDFSFPTLSKGCFKSMFESCTQITSATLPWTTLANNCYQSMFKGCVRITQAPVLPATTLKDYCYASMFQGCTQLTVLPELPAMNLAEYCYSEMFSGCTALNQKAVLPATTLKNYCYYGMFKGCSSLASTPDLNSVSLADHCYHSMFQDCYNIRTAPTLPATVMKDSCYHSMLYGTGITVSPVLPSEQLADHCYDSMMYGTYITRVPDLPAKTLAPYCYASICSNCANITNNEGYAIELPATTLAECCYYCMFYENVNQTVFPTLNVMTMATGCYKNMFSYCKQMTEAVNLPSTTLAPFCYAGMFYHCDALVTPSNLPATTLADGCYSIMYGHCAKLASAPAKLAATVMKPYCYQQMFFGCTSLKSVPDDYLPGIELARCCYEHMFQLSGLEKAPAIPTSSTNFADFCCNSMFAECTSLKDLALTNGVYLNLCGYPEYHKIVYNPIYPTEILTEARYIITEGCLYHMFSGCTSLNVYSTYTDLQATGKTVKKIFDNLPSYNLMHGYAGQEYQIMEAQMFGKPQTGFIHPKSSLPGFVQSKDIYTAASRADDGVRDTPVAGETYYIMVPSST